MKRQIENHDNEPNKRQKKLIEAKPGPREYATIIDISSFNYLSQDNYNMILQKTGDCCSLFSLLFVAR
jgi:hypothetical protein